MPSCDKSDANVTICHWNTSGSRQVKSTHAEFHSLSFYLKLILGSTLLYTVMDIRYHMVT